MSTDIIRTILLNIDVNQEELDLQNIQVNDENHKEYTYVNSFKFLSAHNKYSFYEIPYKHRDAKYVIAINQIHDDFYTYEQVRYEENKYRVSLLSQYHMDESKIHSVKCREQSDYETLYRF